MQDAAVQHNDTAVCKYVLNPGAFNKYGIAHLNWAALYNAGDNTAMPAHGIIATGAQNFFHARAGVAFAGVLQ